MTSKESKHGSELRESNNFRYAINAWEMPLRAQRAGSTTVSVGMLGHKWSENAVSLGLKL